MSDTPWYALPSAWFGQAQQALFETVVQPLVFGLGMANHLEAAFDATGWFLVGLLQLAILGLAFGWLERRFPAERAVAGVERHPLRTDIVYTLIHKLGLVSIGLYFSIGPLFDALGGQAHLLGFDGWQLDQLWPGVTDVPWVSFLLYLVVFDLVDYWLHRGQHRWAWWWSLHALHHSQQRMTRWSDDRNHLIDDFIRAFAIAGTAQLIGVEPGQFVLLVACTQLLQSLSHANVASDFGPLGRWLVSPRFHRLHHAIGVGHESHGPGSLGGCNFAVLFPVWDRLFGTADFSNRTEPTGVRDQLPGGAPAAPGVARRPDGGRDYGSGFWAQQWLALRRVVGRA